MCYGPSSLENRLIWSENEAQHDITDRRDPENAVFEFYGTD